MSRSRVPPADARSSWSAIVSAPVCALGIRTDGGAVIGVAYLAPDTLPCAASDAIAERTVREIERYLDDPGTPFTVPLAPRGTAFQRRVWGAIGAIPAGEVRTYGELSRKLVTAARAVGQACGANPIALLIPCHRVVGAMGTLGGFMGGSERFGEPTRAGTQGSASARASDSLFAPNATTAASRHTVHAGSDPAGAPRVAFVDGAPAAIKRWLLAHERTRYGP